MTKDSIYFCFVPQNTEIPSSSRFTEDNFKSMDVDQNQIEDKKPLVGQSASRNSDENFLVKRQKLK